MIKKLFLYQYTLLTDTHTDLGYVRTTTGHNQIGSARAYCTTRVCAAFELGSLHEFLVALAPPTRVLARYAGERGGECQAGGRCGSLLLLFLRHQLRVYSE